MRFKYAAKKLVSIFLPVTCITCIFLHLFWINWSIESNNHQTPHDDRNSNPRAREEQTSVPCRPQKNIVYIKMNKCASETLTSIFRRYGHGNNLSFVLPPGNKIYLGWPYQMEPMYYRPSKTGEYNILCEHAIYNPKLMESIMPSSDTVYVTSLREPYAQFKSMFNYYELQKISGLVDEREPLATYLGNLEYYERIYKAHESAKPRYCVPDNFSMSYNLMSYVLGFSTGAMGLTRDLSHDEIAVKKWLDNISQSFHHVLIVEYFDESLILLRRLLCWSWFDVLYLKGTNSLSYAWNDTESHRNRDRYKQWSRVDVILYDHFEKIMLRKIKTERKLQEEVREFKEVLWLVNDFCQSAAGFVRVPKNQWSDEFIVTKEDCRMMSDTVYMLRTIKHSYDVAKTQVKIKPHPAPEKNVC